MKNYFKILTISVFTFLMTFNVETAKAQDFGADIVSSYVWRGLQYHQGAAVQPWLELETGGLSGGVWGSFPVTAGDEGHELDLWVSYDFGPLAITATQYTFPDEFGFYGSELLDGDFEVSGSTSIGSFDLTAGYFTDSEALYIEAGFPIGPVGIAVGYGDGWYTTDGDGGIVNVSMSGEKEIKITDDFSLPVFGSFIFNPEAEAAYIVFGVSL